ncbi:MAG: hypothetical protein IT379_16765 [Deltaproteobacteria bacterium]|nr:hypothetical protein [Deltaproteobacteria bacterium]
MAEPPKLTDAEADQMRFWLHPWDDGGLSLAKRGLLSLHYKTPFADGITDLGRAALAAYDAKKRAEVASEAMRTHFRIHSFDEWREDYGAVLWFTLPIEEPPWCGTPNDEDWPWVLVAREDTCWCLLPSFFYEEIDQEGADG